MHIKYIKEFIYASQSVIIKNYHIILNETISYDVVDIFVKCIKFLHTLYHYHQQ